MKEVRGIRTRTDLQLECNGVPGALVQHQSLYLIFFFAPLCTSHSARSP